MSRRESPDQLYRAQCRKVESALGGVHNAAHVVKQRQAQVEQARAWREEALQRGTTPKSGMYLSSHTNSIFILPVVSSLTQGHELHQTRTDRDM